MKVDLEKAVCGNISLEASSSQVDGIVNVTAPKVLWKISIVDAMSGMDLSLEIELDY